VTLTFGVGGYVLCMTHLHGMGNYHVTLYREQADQDRKGPDRKLFKLESRQQQNANLWLIEGL